MSVHFDCKSVGKVSLFPKTNMLFAFMVLAIGVFGRPAVSMAQTDEIQVYDAAIAEQGKFNLMIHSNFTPKGRTTPAFPDAVISNHAFVGVAEWAYGVRPWFEQGL